MSSSSENEASNPEDATSDAKIAINSLNSKARTGYIRKYESFINWKKLKGAKGFSEDVFLEYFKELSKTKKPSTLWAVFSMLKATVNAKKNIQISKYRNLVAFIKKQSAGHKSRKSKTFSALNFATFLEQAPDYNYLAIKVALIFGVNGACRNNQLTSIRLRDVQKHSDQLIVVNLMSLSSPTKLDRAFMILGNEVKIVEKYMALRPKRMRSDRFFVQYQFGRCRQQVIGTNNFSTYPRRIATCLKLPNPELYSGHCFRRTAITMRAEPELALLRERGWRGGCVEEKSLENKTPDVAVKVERADSEVPFDFIAVEEAAPPSRPPSPPPRRRPKLHPLYRLIRELQQRRLKLDEEREREEHMREMERLRVQARRVEVDAECNAMLRSIADVALALLQRPHGNGYVAARHG